MVKNDIKFDLSTLMSSMDGDAKCLTSKKLKYNS